MRQGEHTFVLRRVRWSECEHTELVLASATQRQRTRVGLCGGCHAKKERRAIDELTWDMSKYDVDEQARVDKVNGVRR